jgi:hypothetical protein
VNLFDRICAVPAMIIGIIFLILGILGLFTGCKANFTLPPILGVLPALVGWGITRSIWIAWKVRKDSNEPAFPVVEPHQPNDGERTGEYQS